MADSPHFDKRYCEGKAGVSCPALGLRSPLNSFLSTFALAPQAVLAGDSHGMRGWPWLGSPGSWSIT